MRLTLSAFIRGIGWSTENVVPFKNIRLSGTGKDERGRRFVEVDEFLQTSEILGQWM